jgi:hypothetical protein
VVLGVTCYQLIENNMIDFANPIRRYKYWMWASRLVDDICIELFHVSNGMQIKTQDRTAKAAEPTTGHNFIATTHFMRLS